MRDVECGQFGPPHPAGIGEDRLRGRRRCSAGRPCRHRTPTPQRPRRAGAAAAPARTELGAVDRQGGVTGLPDPDRVQGALDEHDSRVEGCVRTSQLPYSMRARGTPAGNRYLGGRPSRARGHHPEQVAVALCARRCSGVRDSSARMGLVPGRTAPHRPTRTTRPFSGSGSGRTARGTPTTPRVHRRGWSTPIGPGKHSASEGGTDGHPGGTRPLDCRDLIATYPDLHMAAHRTWAWIAHHSTLSAACYPAVPPNTFRRSPPPRRTEPRTG